MTSGSLEIAGPHSGHDAAHAFRNAVKLAASLVCTWGIALAVRFVLPRHLGPEHFGELSFSDGFSGAALVLLSLGLESYARLTVPVRPQHASEFFAGVTAVRLVLGAAIFGGISIAMHASHRPPAVQQLVYIYAVAHFLLQTNGTLNAFLHSKGKVDGMSILAVVTKLVWGGGILLAIVLQLGLWAYAASFLACELIETIVLLWLCRKHLGLQLTRFDLTATRTALVGSLPFYLFGIVHNVYGRADVTVLGLMADDREVGWYGAAQALGGASLLFAPLVGWVVTPMFVRAAARSAEELDAAARRVMEMLLIGSAPIVLAFWLGADFWIQLLFGAAFAPAALPLRVLGASQIVMYVAIVASSMLSVINLRWRITVITIVAMSLNLAFNLWWIRPLRAFLGPGGGGAACALATFTTEAISAAVMCIFIGRRIFDRRTASTVVRLAISAAAVVGIDHLLRTAGPMRLVADGIAFVAIALATRAVRIGEVIAFVKLARTAKAAS